ncbi:mandelate racemase/muconate lactonizing enzyme family protein [Spelaeicoccus albus]|uniref:L-alanine-DL-glutamate epimerase-like enolase superfamily enzyme n=1 Tax=Spelaeicoccus albus TaxID=1280376 RepID=A0A7Z0A9W5_9MICO|nr:mandelate racemase/muconate lactonizing enzyme family protein [Spelaeicoccus albus]NYI67099.1 L-alanine-DL-glutamate epimerase-like enolase superfamily enzyme [Spelaeicoccus albus]
MSFSALTARRVCVVEVEADGLTGIGESWINYPNWAAEERVATVLQGAAPIVLGSDVSDPSVVQERLIAQLRGLGRQWGAPGPIWQAISGIDLALWDLAAKRAGLPAHELLDGDTNRTSLPAYASGVGPTDVQALCELAMERGLRAVKAKVGFGRDADENTLKTIRSVCGMTTRIFADANQAWTLDEAIELTRLMSDYGVEWLEEPIDGNRLNELEALYAATGMPLAAGENNYGEDQFVGLVKSPAIHHIQPDPAKSGGLTMAQTAATAARNSTNVSPHWYGAAIGLAAAVHLGAANTSVDWIELDVRNNPLRSDLPAHGWVLNDGAITVPQTPGLLGELNADVVAQYQTKEVERRKNAE